MTFVHPPRSNLGNRFSQPAKETLVSWINEKNNRGFYPHQFTFSDPIKLDDDGTVEIPFTYNPTGESSSLEVQRVNIGKVPGLKNLVIYPDAITTESILLSLYREYGLYLDKDMVSVSTGPVSLDKILVGDKLDGFGNDEVVESQVHFDQLECSITMLDNHLVYEGVLNIVLAKSVLHNTDSIARRMSLRDYYAQDGEGKPYVETFQPKGLWLVDKTNRYLNRDLIDESLYTPPLDRELRRELESRLFHVDKREVVDYHILAEVLTKVTGSKWVAENSVVPFNVMNSRVLYNGLASDQPGIAPVSHSYLLILELSGLCENLQGRVHIAYRYSTPSHPAAFPGGYNYLR